MKSSIAKPELPRTFIELARMRAQSLGDTPLYTFLSEDETQEKALTFSQLDHQARAIAAQLQARGSRGERALLLYPPGLEYIAAFFGSMYAEAIAVPLYLPRPSRTHLRFDAVASDARPKFLLTSAAALPRVKLLIQQCAALKGAHLLVTDQFVSGTEDAWQSPNARSSTAAMLQYTSGSAGRAKGVLLTHDNLLHNQALIADAFKLGSETVIVSWLPMHHDMGLIGGVLQPLFGGYHCVLMSPAAFSKSPLSWLKAISRFEATTSGGPNFAYELCTRGITNQQRESLDLSSWRVAFNGAEPVRDDTLTRFTVAFERCGFRRSAFYPCYGLAEATLIVAGGKSLSEPRTISVDTEELKHNRVTTCASESSGTQTLVSSGRPGEGQTVVIVDPQALTTCAPNQIGEIWVKGRSVAEGYWSQPYETEETFAGRLHDSGEGPFLRTGDLGFIYEGELFISGRLKDLIIIRGLNYYPQDIEASVEASHSALRHRGAAAFSIEVEGEEHLVIVQEVDRQLLSNTDEVFRSIRIAIGNQHDLDVYAIALIRTGTIPKTSSGKIQRSVCHERFLLGDLKIVAEWVAPLESKQEKDTSTYVSSDPHPGRTAIEGMIINIWCEVLHVEHVGRDEDFFSLGGNSLAAAQVASRLSETIAANVGADLVFEAFTVATLAERLETLMTGELDHLPLTPAGARSVYPLSYAQQRMWFLEQLVPGNPFYNTGIEARIKGSLNVAAVEESFRRVLERHDALRTSFSVSNGEPVQVISPAVVLKVSQVDLSELSESEQEYEISRRGEEESCRAFDFAQAPLLRVSLLHLSHEQHVLLLTTHHIVCDGNGVSLLISELNELYQAITAGEEATFAPLTIQYQDFSVWQKEVFAVSEQFQEQGLYWRKKLTAPLSVLELRTDFPSPESRTNRGANISVELDESLVDSLRTFAEQQHVTLFMLLLCALKILLHRWTRQRDIVVGTVIANRNRHETEQLIGCFLNFLALRTEISSETPAAEILADVSRTVREAFANQDYPFEKLVEDLRPVRDSSRNPIYKVGLWLHNYALPSLFEESLDSETRLITTHTADLDLRAVVFEKPLGSLEITFEYSTDLFRAESISELLDSYVTILTELVRRPETKVGDFHLHEKLINAESGRSASENSLLLVVAATFTAEPIEPFLSFWLDQVGIPASIRFTPYNQVFQQLLDPASLLNTNENGINIVLIYPESLIPGEEVTEIASRHQLEQNVQYVCHALQSRKHTTRAPLLLCLCPGTTNRSGISDYTDWLPEVQRLISAEAAQMPEVEVLDISAAASLYDVEKVYDRFTDQIGNIPYTSEFFAAAAAAIARRIYARLSSARKVIVLDCDQTLWRGICGEDGWQEIEITVPHLELQEFMLRQRDQGILLCLCSKNSDHDVLDVFRHRSDMRLRLEDFSARRVNWEAKSANLKSLAHELQLPLNSFILIDDDAVACAEVREQCPEVLTLELPRESSEIPAFLARIWAFDRPAVTTMEDRSRSLMYRQNQLREQSRSKALTLEEFLAGLELKLTIAAPNGSQVQRMAQLTQRTNQFNSSGIKRSDLQIEQLISADACQCLVAHLTDRFGDYGLIGMLVYRFAADALEVETFLLSCRALGRRVEHEMLLHMCHLAEAQGLTQISIPFLPTDRNAPALSFLRETFGPGQRQNGSTLVFTASIETLKKSLGAKCDNELALAMDDDDFSSGALAPVATAATTRNLSETMQRLAMHFDRAERVVKAVGDRKRERPGTRYEYIAPRTIFEEVLANIWADVLGVERIGIHDNFFEFGGHSLLATQLLSRVHNEFGAELSLQALFAQPTIAGLSTVITQRLLDTTESVEAALIVEEIKQLTDRNARALLEKEIAETD